ncbi:hypothetical protein [Tunicatimonas pelagia]|uniref:hypothetical protein n=1 Tax=Tunicatimonas pelagia TaxID=931531 RepID=UPI002665C939|nr:hypothetical protein [Tunicatimonas pelagia]WKN46500.1 hypothetical protein P0M28_30585 [Tunicatimonas pelagia]
MNNAQTYAVRIVIAQRLGYHPNHVHLIDLSMRIPFPVSSSLLMETEGRRWVKQIIADNKVKEGEAIYQELVREYPILEENQEISASKNSRYNGR